ncbi:MAG: DUF2491 family protein [Pseudomonadota bacterium]
MASNWGLLKRIWQKKANEYSTAFRESKTERIDKDLPLGLRISGMVEVPIVDFVLGGDDLKIKHPGTRNPIAACGKFDLGGSGVHRFYLEADSDIYTLQIAADRNNRIEECKLFMPLDEVYPETVADWDFWLSPQDGSIGLDAFQTKDEILYNRVWSGGRSGTGQIDRVLPLEFEETVYHDPEGAHRESIKYRSMLYGRHVNERVDEYLLLSAVEEDDGAAIQIMVGIEIDPGSLVVY